MVLLTCILVSFTSCYQNTVKENLIKENTNAYVEVFNTTAENELQYDEPTQSDFDEGSASVAVESDKTDVYDVSDSSNTTVKDKDEKEDDDVTQNDTAEKNNHQSDFSEGPAVSNPVPVEKINLNNYKPHISYNELDDDVKEIVDRVLNAVKHGDETLDTVVIDCSDVFEGDIPYDTRVDAAFFLSIYYGDFHLLKDGVIYATCKSAREPDLSYIGIEIDRMREFEQNKDRYITLVEDVLETVTEGSETEKLMQVAYWMVENYTYDTNTKSVSEFWDQKRANCTVASTVFRMFAERLGVPCDVVVGYAFNGEYHAWNRVMLSDGTYRYYDVTLYKGYGEAYLNSTKSMSNQVCINGYA